MAALLYWAMVQTVGFILFQVKLFWFRRCSIDIRPIDFALPAHFALSETFVQESRFYILTKSKDPMTADVTKTGNGEWGMGNGMIPGNGKLKWEFEKKI